MFESKTRSSIDRIEYDFTIQISDLQNGVCAHVRACVRACAVKIKLGMLRAACPSYPGSQKAFSNMQVPIYTPRKEKQL